MLKINLPHSMWDYKISGVYKILFTDGYFYIGCSKHLRSRASSWESIFRTGKGVPGVEIGTATINRILANPNATFDILELCSPEEVKDKEAFYLDKERDNSLMVSKAECSWKPVLQYNKESGVFIRRHISISEAARYNKTTIGRIQDVLYGIRNSHKEMTFVFESDYKQRRVEINKNRWMGLERKKGRLVVMMDINGVELGKFKKLTEAAETAKCCTQNIRRAISGKQNTAGGYIWKYA